MVDNVQKYLCAYIEVKQTGLAYYWAISEKSIPINV